LRGDTWKHQGKEPDRTREAPNTRLVSYVCMTPRSMATPAQETKKRKAFDELRTTSHWPHRIKLFPWLREHSTDYEQDSRPDIDRSWYEIGWVLDYKYNNL
jgi:hypothetical protein